MAHEGKGSATIPDDSTSTFLTIPIRQGASRLWASFANSADSAFDVFTVAVQPGGSDAGPAYATVATVASDYTTNIQWPMEGCGADLASLAKSANGVLAMDVKGLQNVRFAASASGVSDTTITWYWSVR